jgi:F0F1-type ATP synthase assembly protein I
VSQPPDYPGRDRLKSAAAAAGSEAYQGAFEAIGSVLVAGAFGYWVDYRWETAPWGLLIGTAVGFAAMVLRLIRLGKELHPDTLGAEESKTGSQRIDEEASEKVNEERE